MPIYAPNHLPEAFRLADLIRAAGEARAQTAGQGQRLASGLVYGVGHAVGDALNARADSRAAQAENAAIADLLTSGQPLNVGEIVRRVGVDRAAQIAKLADAARPEPEKITTRNPQDDIVGADGRIIAAGIPKAPEPPKPLPLIDRGEQGIYDPNVMAYQPGTAFTKPQKDAPAPAVGSFEDYVRRYAGEKGKDIGALTPADVEDARKRYQQADDRPRITINTPTGPPPGNFDLTGEEFLRTIPKDWQALVRKVAAYDEDPTRVVGMRGGAREQLMKWVNQFKPDYDQSAFTTIGPTRKAFTIGVQGRQINALNTAIGHIDQMTNLADQLDNSGFVPANQAFNRLRTLFGSDKVTNFDTLKDALGGEIAGVLAQNGATVSAIQDAKSHISNASSAKQLAGYVRTQIPILGSKLASLTDAYQKGMQGHDPGYSALSEASKSILQKHGFNPEHPEVGVQPAGGAKTVQMRAPDGRPLTVPLADVAAAERLGATRVP